jgi:hypothetical protein
MKQIGLGIIVALGLTLPAFGQEAVYPEEGVYILNPAKSTFRGPATKNQILYVGKEQQRDWLLPRWQIIFRFVPKQSRRI